MFPSSGRGASLSEERTTTTAEKRYTENGGPVRVTYRPTERMIRKESPFGDAVDRRPNMSFTFARLPSNGRETPPSTVRPRAPSGRRVARQLLCEAEPGSNAELFQEATQRNARTGRFFQREREREPQDPRRCFGTPKTYQLGCLLWLLFWAAFDLQVSKNLCTDPQVVAQVMMAQPNPDPVGSGSGA